MDDDALAQIGKIASLQRLRLSYTDMSDSGLKHLAGLTKLQVLDLSARISPTPVWRMIAALANLRELYLNHARFTDKGLASEAAAETRTNRVVPDPHDNAGVGGSRGPEESRGSQARLHSGRRQRHRSASRDLPRDARAQHGFNRRDRQRRAAAENDGES